MGPLIERKFEQEGDVDLVSHFLQHVRFRAR
jgi:hypothetical protein